MILQVQAKHRDAKGDLIATVLDGRGGTEDLRLEPEAAAEVERVWAQSQFDLDRYARLPVEFPAPVAIPVEIAEPV